MLIAFPLISVGTMEDRPFLWGFGLASLTIGALIPPIMRFILADEPKEEGEGGAH